MKNVYRSRSKTIGIKLGHSIIKVHFLTFTNDTMIFTKALVESCNIIKYILDSTVGCQGYL